MRAHPRWLTKWLLRDALPKPAGRNRGAAMETGSADPSIDGPMPTVGSAKS